MNITTNGNTYRINSESDLLAFIFTFHHFGNLSMWSNSRLPSRK